MESGRVPVEGGIRPSTDKLFGPVWKNGRLSVCIGTLLNPGENPQKVQSARVPKNYLDKYGKMVESV